MNDEQLIQAVRRECKAYNGDQFRDRDAEPAAWQAGVVLASAIEWHLVTLDDMEMRKSTSKSDLRRQREVCNKLVFHFFDLNIRAHGLGSLATRLQARIDHLNSILEAK